MSDINPTKEQLQIFKKLKEVTEPYYVHSDQMIAIATWIDAEFEHKSKANEVAKQPDTESLRLQNVSNIALIDYIENDAEIAMPIDEFFNEDGTSITKKQYGKVLLKYLVKELRAHFC